MNKIQKWILKKICKKIVKQGPDHKDNIIEYYRIMNDASKREFFEDNDPTLQGFLRECHETAFIPEIQEIRK